MHDLQFSFLSPTPPTKADLAQVLETSKDVGFKVEDLDPRLQQHIADVNGKRAAAVAVAAPPAPAGSGAETAGSGAHAPAGPAAKKLRRRS